MKCMICEQKCEIPLQGTGRCGMMTADARGIREQFPDRYLAAVDTAIESMPMVHYHPKGTFLQVCTVGCNFTCPGCVSEIITDHLGAIRGQFQEMTPEQVIDRAEQTSARGVMFCFNEPTVSFFTFMRLARMAKERGLLAGCATNGYMTEWAMSKITPFLDFVNIGIKGTSPEVCAACGIRDTNPIFRNIRLFHQKGIHVEISAVYKKGREDEIEQTARFIASLSRQIPFQVMRFMPFGNSDLDDEPRVMAAEALCRRLGQHLDHVFLFNTPGTGFLNSTCPECGQVIMARGFFGPMCANLYKYQSKGRCSCGYQLPLKGKIHEKTRSRLSGYFGGYRTVNAMSMIRAILGVLGVKDKAVADTVMADAVRSDLIDGLYARLNRIDAYFDTVDTFADVTETRARAAFFREYVGEKVRQIREQTRGVPKPRVYYCLGHPLIAMFGEKMESCLARTAGGDLTNQMARKESRPGITIDPREFGHMAPQIIVVADTLAWPPADVIAWCKNNSLSAPAIREEKIFGLHPFRSSTNPDWILGLMALANIIHPSIFKFDLKKEADTFYNTFYGHPFNNGRLPAFPWEEKQ
ncbi:radical SAM protein [Desulfobacter vibrioformis]|uniref:radical SAM protein n=1 Tax=Desulfobacter vibrioformis TaxID=34031 RepID=UPI0005574B73|nr:radical SAM protein [Desulfobacter vibrioformis]